MYRRLADSDCLGRGLAADTAWFDVAEGYPSNACATRMVGGPDVRAIVEEIKSLVDQAPRAPILFVGPPGTGKELAARVVFEAVVKRTLCDLATGVTCHPPVVVGTRFESFNCAALVDTLAESLLFGVVRGAGTDVTSSPGVILEAGEGVVFLDELSFLKPAQQGKLLRVFEDGHVRPVGHPEVPYSALIVAAMSDDPDDPALADKLLPALYGRFRGRVVRIPPVAERVGDIPALLTAFAGRPIRMSEIVLRGLIAGTYDSNVRDLERIIARAERRQRGPSSGGALEITTEDFGGNQQLPRSLGWAHETAERQFGFVARTADADGRPVAPTVDFQVFKETSRVLSSLTVHEQKLIMREPTSSQLAAGNAGLNFKDARMAALQWIRSIGSLGGGEHPGNLEPRLRECLGASAKTRWPAPQALAFRWALVDAFDIENERLSASAKLKGNRLAWSLDVDPANLRGPRA